MVGFAVVFGLLAVFLANAWLNNRAAQTMRDLAAQQKTAPPAHTLVVASKPMKFGDVITSSSLREISWPDNAVPQGAFSKIGELTAGKRVVLIPIAVNEPILASNITGPGQRGTLSSLLKDGLKAVTIRVNDVGDVGGFVLPGDHVDVVLTRPGDRKVSVNDVMLQDVRVLGVDQLADNTTDKARGRQGGNTRSRRDRRTETGACLHGRHAVAVAAQGRRDQGRSDAADFAAGPGQ